MINYSVMVVWTIGVNRVLVCMFALSSIPSHSYVDVLSGLLSVMAPVLQRLVTFALRVLLSLLFLGTVEDQGISLPIQDGRSALRCI